MTQSQLLQLLLKRHPTSVAPCFHVVVATIRALAALYVTRRFHNSEFTRVSYPDPHSLMSPVTRCHLLNFSLAASKPKHTAPVLGVNPR